MALSRPFILTGAPGAGKTALALALERRGYPFVPEAATDVIALAAAEGRARPWEEAGFVPEVLALQQARMRTDASFHDRSVVCTLALCRFLGCPEPAALLAACAGARDEFDRRVLFVRLQGSIENTAARQIDYAGALAFEALHERVYCEFGFELIDIAPGPLSARAEAALAVIGPSASQDRSAPAPAR